MSEKDPKDLIAEYQESFGPKEKAEAVLFLLFEYKDETEKLSPADQDILEGKMNLLRDQIHDENGDTHMIRGLTSELKGFLIKIGCPAERMDEEKLIQFRNARLISARKEYGSEGGGRRTRSICRAKEKRIQKLARPPKFYQKLVGAAE